MTLSLGTPIGHYTVIEPVCAEGTTAEVYRGRDERHGRVVALTLFPGTSERSRREAVAVAALDHPNIVATFDVIEHNGRLCLVQEWIDGGSLADELCLTGQLGVAETVRLGHDVASALRYAHQHDILHRDIKPSNVLRTVGGTYKLADFGAFGQLEVVTATTRAGEIAGTPLYLSPEQITGAPQTPASDLFGLGLLLYRCLYGRLPDETETAASYLQLAYNRTQTLISVPPSPLQGLLQRCLALDPAQRPRSAAEVLTELDQIAPIQPRQESAATAPRRQAPPQPEVVLPRFRGLSRAAPSGIPRRLALAVAVAFLVTTFLGLVIALLVTAPVPPTAPRAAPPTAPRTAPPTAPPTPIAPPPALLNPVNGLVRVGAGLAVAGVALAVAQQIRRRWTSRAPEAERRAATILVSTGQREELSPWHVRHKDAIATGVAVVGALAGVATVVSGFLR